MPVRASTFVNLYKFPMGRAVFALRSMADRAREVGAREIEDMATHAAERVQSGMAAVLLSANAPGARAAYPPETVSFDNLLDRTVTGIDSYLDVQIRIYPGEPVAESAERVRQELFPAGAGEITGLPFVEEHERINVLLDQASSADLAADMQRLPELPAMLTRLRERNREYGALLRKAKDVPTREEVRAIHDEAQDLLASAVALVLGLHQLRASSGQPTDQREHLLEPVLQQNEALRQARRRRRAPVDVDPDTGEELDHDVPAPEVTPDATSDANAEAEPATMVAARATEPTR